MLAAERLTGIRYFLPLLSRFRVCFYVQCWWKSGWKPAHRKTQWLIVCQQRKTQTAPFTRHIHVHGPLHFPRERHSSRVRWGSRVSAQVKQKLNWLKSVAELRASASMEPSPGPANTKQNVVYYRLSFYSSLPCGCCSHNGDSLGVTWVHLPQHKREHHVSSREAGS